MKEIKSASLVINSQFAKGFESISSFRDTCFKFLDDLTAHGNKEIRILKAQWLDTALGPMIAIGDDNYLYLLEFATRRNLAPAVERLRKSGFAIIPADSALLKSIASELESYFAGTLKYFKTPYHVFGSAFQQQVWQSLCKVPYGETCSYAKQALSMGKPKAYRAVANANGANQLALIIPCHRIIAADGSLGGYGAGIEIKKWLINHEKSHKISDFY